MTSLHSAFVMTSCDKYAVSLRSSARKPLLLVAQTRRPVWESAHAAAHADRHRRVFSETPKSEKRPRRWFEQPPCRGPVSL